MKIPLLNKKFIYFLIIVFSIQFLLIFIAAAMFMDGAGNYQNEGNFVLNILKYIFGAPLYWFLDFNKVLNNLNFFTFTVFFINTVIQWNIYSYLRKFIKNKVNT